MRITLDPTSPADYATFLKVKALPKFRIVGRTATVPDEYAALLGLSEYLAAPVAYEPLPGLFDYQRAIARLAILKEKFATFVEPGYGKTLIEGEFARHAARVLPADKCVLIVAPLMVVPQLIEEYAKFYGDMLPVRQLRAGELSEWLTAGTDRVGITNYEALKDETPQGRLGALILDECFAKGTKVDLVDENGAIYQKDIENVLRGDRIANASGTDRVSDVHRREVKYAVAVECGETRVIASPGHPFFTQRGWVGAQDLRPGDAVLGTGEAVRVVRRGVHARDGSFRAVLRSVLLSEMADEHAGAQGEGPHGRDAREDRQGAGEVAAVGNARGGAGVGAGHGVESYVRPSGAPEGLPPIESDEARTFRAWGEREWFDGASADFAGCTTVELGSGVLFVTGPTDCRLSHALQDRLGRSREQDGYRGGWQLSLREKSEGQKEGFQAGFTRVASVQILEQGHPELEGLRDADGKLYFYDLGGTRHPSFSVSGLLVHNSSMLKSAYGKWGQTVIRLGKGLRWKLAATGTPAPNDRIEFANHAVFLDAFPTVNSFLARFFVNRGQTDNRWELKPHALEPFYRALAHWSIFLTNPATYGWKDNAGTLPPIHVHVHDVTMSDAQRAAVQARTGDMFGTHAGGITSRSVLSQIAKGSIKGERIETHKPEFIRRLVESWPAESTLVWCLYNAEQELMERTFPGAHSISGATPHADRVRMLDDFKAGRVKVLVSKAEILGFGLNLQVCTRQVFSGLQDSYEEFYQAVKRSNRVGSTRPLNVHIPITPIERPMIETVLSKAKRVQRDAEEQERIFRSIAHEYLAV